VPNWNELLDEIKAAGSTHDMLRRKYLNKLHRLTKRNVIIYYSGWLQKAQLASVGSGVEFGINDQDKNGFMSAVHQLDRARGLDLILHTPGGETAATESLVDYLRAMFPDIRAIVPQLAMSAGTMVALACSEIVMGKHSSLGPIDPQIMGIPAHGVIEEFDRARIEIGQRPEMIPVWQPLIAKYPPAFIGECEKAIEWSKEMVKEWLVSGMFAGDAKAEAKADAVVAELADHAITKSHARHISPEKAVSLNLNVSPLESDPALQEAVLSVHHACIHTLSATPAYKIVENHKGVAFIQQLGQLVLSRPS
jgi:membrane-bound ClpP family serine protease